MRLIHSVSCKGPPLGCQRGYWWIAGILSFGSAGEGLISRILADSYAGQADALHMALHGVFYGSIIYLGFLSKKKQFSAADEVKVRLRYARWNVAALLTFLAYIIAFEVIPRFWNTAIVSAPELIFAALVGISGTFASLAILWKMRKDHGGYERGKECDRGRKSSHGVLFLDAIGDIGISLMVIAEALNIWINPRLFWIDPILTLTVAGIIIWQSCAMLKSLRKDELNHAVHHH